MLIRTVVSALLVFGLVQSPSASAIDPATLLFFGLQAGTATGFLQGCRLFLNTLKPSQATVRESVAMKEKIDARMSEVLTPEDSIVFVNEISGDKVKVRAHRANGTEFPEELGLALTIETEVDGKIAIQFDEAFLRGKDARTIMSRLLDHLVKEHSYSSSLQIKFVTSDDGKLSFEIQGAKDEQEKLNAYLMILKSWAQSFV
jgi:hypothetical protein